MEIKRASTSQRVLFKDLKYGATFRELEFGTELLLKTDEGDAVALDDGCIYKDYDQDMEVVIVNGYFQEIA